ncbi:MAG TPA: nickel-binding protein [Acidimicrobiia bacterium]|nr:nickel-binding protein [Acidimicrobiia bacterium]
MPLYLDRHDAEGVTPEDVAQAHLLDLEVQAKYGVTYLTYWFDYEKQSAFCLVDAPDPETASAVHAEAHGLVAGKILPVDRDAVMAFLGRIDDPESPGPIAESGVRTILFTDLVDSTAITQRLGDEGAMALLRAHDEVVRSALRDNSGREVKHTGDGIMASFASVARAAECAACIQRALLERSVADEAVRVRIGINAGEPVTENDDLFGTAVQLAARLCAVAEPGEVLVSSTIKDLAAGKPFSFEPRGPFELKGFSEPTPAFALLWT